MRLIKRVTLHFKAGTSDKIYEVDLCEVGPDRFVVNFRYGRRGGTLREGSKTVLPVSRAEADNTFDKLVAAKIKKGYRDITDRAAPSESVPQKTRPTPTKESQAEAVLNRLRQGDSPPPGQRWSLERAIWRAGELGLAQAAPRLLELVGSGDPLRDYCLIWALGRCGSPGKGRAEPLLRRLYENGSTPDPVRRIAAEALLRLVDEAGRADFRAGLIESLPSELRELARSGPPGELAMALQAYLDSDDSRRFAVLDTLYLVDNQNVRPALLHIARTAPLRPPYFQRIRHIFKAAEYRADAEMFGLLAYRFEKRRAMFSNNRYGGNLSRDSRWFSWVYASEIGFVRDARQEIRKPDAKIAYGSRTRNYLRQRVWRTLRRLGQLGDLTYVKLAVEILLAYSDADARPVRKSVYYSWQARQTRTIHWDAYANYWPFNHILYENSPRYLRKPNSSGWRCRPPYRPGDPAPDLREEAFPRLWEQRPDALLRLLAESECRPVHEFAVKALRDCPRFCAELPVETVIMLLNRPYEATVRFGFELAQARYEPYRPDRGLVLAVAGCLVAEARAEAHRWIDQNRGYFLEDSDFVVALTVSRRADTRAFAQKLLRSAALSEAEARLLIGRLIAHLLTLEAAQTDLAADLADTIFQSFGWQLHSLGLEVIQDLLAHPLQAAQELGGNILLHHNLGANDLPEAIITALIASPYEVIRGIGLKLFGQLSDFTLLKQEKLIVSLAMHELPDLRQAIRPVIRRLSRTDPTFAGRLSALFFQVLLGPEPHEGVHDTLVRLLQEDLGERWMIQAEAETAWLLLESQAAAAQELGGRLIAFKLDQAEAWAKNFETAQIVSLADHEIAAVRRAAQALFLADVGRFKQASNPRHRREMAVAIRLLDCAWEEDRRFWFDTFRRHFGEADYSPAILVGICDSVQPETQQFGRELITRYFAESAGQEYLLKLSEHPSADLQLFAANFLEQYAADNPARLEALQPYFVTVLSRVNRGRVAKDRVMAFLTAEAHKSEAAARIVARILTRQSATIAIGDKAAALEAMVHIHRRYPHLPLPIRVKEPEARHAV